MKGKFCRGYGTCEFSTFGLMLGKDDSKDNPENKISGTQAKENRRYAVMILTTRRFNLLKWLV